MKFKVQLTQTAERDVFEICRYIAAHDGLDRADEILAGIEETIGSLDTAPQRGHHPPELLRIGVPDYREIHYKPWRIVYRIDEGFVNVYCVLDGRRNLKDLLFERLVR